MSNTLQSLLCRHTWYWSERHGADRCRRCGKLSSEGSAPAVAVPTSAARPAGPRPLRERLDALALGGDLSRDEILLTVIELIEDAQTARPQLDGAAAAHYFAVLNGARRLHA